MVEFLQSYGVLIFFGLLVFLLMRGRARGGMGCGMGGHQSHDGESQYADADGESQYADADDDKVGGSRNSGGCH